MFRSSKFLIRTLASVTKPPLYISPAAGFFLRPVALFSRAASNEEAYSDPNRSSSDVSLAEAKKLLRLANVEALKKKLGMESEDVMEYSKLLKTCVGLGVVKSDEEAKDFARVLDEAGVVLLFRDKVYLHPEKVVDLVRKVIPLALATENDPRVDEMKKLTEKKEEIDALAHRHVRRILWTGLGIFMVQVGLFFRLTFWEFSWDVMEPIAFFTTSTGLVLGYAYFLFTSRDPSYQDFMKRLFLSRQKKLIRKQNFDIHRYMELQKQCKNPCEIVDKELEMIYKD